MPDASNNGGAKQKGHFFLTHIKEVGNSCISRVLGACHHNEKEHTRVDTFLEGRIDLN